MKIVVNNKQGYKIYHNLFGRWGLRGVPSTPPGPDLTEPFYIESRGDVMNVNIKKNNSSAPTIPVEYSFDKTTWQSLGSTSTTTLTINVPAGGKVWLRSKTNRWATNTAYYNYIATSSPSNVGGNIMSLLYGDTFIGQREFPSLLTYIFGHLFRNGDSGTGNIVDASKLILPTKTLSQYCYYGMFRNCTSLNTAPGLPATTLILNCYGYMFRGCTSLTTAPELPATTLAQSCYQQMFRDCTNLNYIKCLATDISASYCLSSWVSNVASSGTFVKKSGVTWPTGADGIPSGWTVVEE